MQSESKLVDDLARLASGAVGTIGGVKREIEDAARARLDRLLADMDLVTREEYEVVLEMARMAREENEQLAAKIDALEKKLTATKPKRPAPARKKAASKS